MDEREQFGERSGLLEKIQADIFPTLVSIETSDGVLGTGFFRHSEYLTSNAHIIPYRELLDLGVTVQDWKGKTLALNAESSYHRPSEGDASPDVVILKTQSRVEGNHKAFPPPPSMFSADPVFDGRHTFYIDIHSNGGNTYEVKYLHLRSKKGTNPLIYECEDGSIPQPGCSGSPIVEVRLTIGKQPVWQFEVVGVLYARCLPFSLWYNKNVQQIGTPISENTLLVCAIPVEPDFGKILKIIRNDEEAVRAQKMADVAETFKDEQGKRIREQYLAQSRQAKEKRDVLWKRFEAGETELNISLPEGLEKLWYGKEIVRINQSLFLESVRTKALVVKKYIEKIKESPSLKDLEEDFDRLIQIIQGEEIVFQIGNNALKSKYFRLDIGVSGNNWRLQIQDNTGRNKRVNNKSLSSIFAEVKVPKNIPSINGSQISELFQESQYDPDGPKEKQFLNQAAAVSHSKPPRKKVETEKERREAEKRKRGESFRGQLNQSNSDGEDDHFSHVSERAERRRDSKDDDEYSAASIEVGQQSTFSQPPNVSDRPKYQLPSAEFLSTSIMSAISPRGNSSSNPKRRVDQQDYFSENNIGDLHAVLASKAYQDFSNRKLGYLIAIDLKFYTPEDRLALCNKFNEFFEYHEIKAEATDINLDGNIYIEGITLDLLKKLTTPSSDEELQPSAFSNSM